MSKKNIYSVLEYIMREYSKFVSHNQGLWRKLYSESLFFEKKRRKNKFITCM